MLLTWSELNVFVHVSIICSPNFAVIQWRDAQVTQLMPPVSPEIVRSLAYPVGMGTLAPH